MANHSNLSSAKKEKNDEFYTRYEDIEAEVMRYKDQFRGKTVLCNCDDPEWSSFWQFFHRNFSFFELKKLISTHYVESGSSYAMIYDGKKDNVEAFTRNDQIDNNENMSLFDMCTLEANGDFRSEECLKYLEEADIVVTNPPFSLFREFVANLVEHDKKFLVIGNVNAITYKEIFPLIKDNKMWIGYKFNGAPMKFEVPDDYELKGSVCGYLPNGKKYVGVGGTCWFTNLDTTKRHEELILWKEYNKKEYPRYDNYDAINVDRTDNIPCDYYGVMGVPITFLDKYNPEQFEIVGISDADSPLKTKSYGDYIGFNQNGTKTGRTGSTFGACPVLVKDDHRTVYYEKDGVRVQATYCRIFIRRKYDNAGSIIK